MTTYYIDPSRGVNGTGTKASPFNVWPASSILVAGDSLLFKRGTTLNIEALNSTYAEFANAYRYINVANFTIDAYGTGEKPIITFNSYYNGGVSSGPITLLRFSDTANNSNFKNIKFVDCQVRGIFNIGGANTGLTIDGVEVYNNVNTWIDNVSENPSPCVCIGFGGNSAVHNVKIFNVVIDGCINDGIWGSVDDRFEVAYTTIKNVNANPAANFHNGDCLQLSGSCTEYRVHHCYMDHSNYDAKQTIIQSGGTAGTTYVHDNVLIGFLGQNPQYFGAVVYSDQKLIMYRNVVTSGYQAVVTSGVGSSVVANVFYCYKTKAGAHIVTLSASGRSGMVVSNNYFKKMDNTLDFTNALCAAVGTNNSSQYVTVANNIFDGNFTNAVQLAGSPNNTVRNNCFVNGVVNQNALWYSTWNPTTTLNPITSDPLLNLSNPLKPKISRSSPCRSAGTSVGYYTDFRGMPFNNPPSIGPFEFTSRSKR